MLQNLISKIILCIDKVIELICAILMAAMVVIINISVFRRYVLYRPLGWSEEIGRALLVWITFLGAYLAYRNRKHMRISILFNKLSNKVQRGTLLFGNIVIIITNIFLIRIGFQYTMEFRGMTTSYLGMSMSYIFVVMPIAAILWTFHCIVQSVEIIKDSEFKFKRRSITDVVDEIDKSKIEDALEFSADEAKD